MSLDALESLIANAAWFVRCGQFHVESGAVPLAAVVSSDKWDWLPTSHDQADPVHGGSLVSELDNGGNGSARRSAELLISKCVLSSLRTVPECLPVLVDGPHDFTPAAKSGAVFAARMAVRELLVGRPAVWHRVVQLYAAGYWPCGWSSEDQTIVVL